MSSGALLLVAASRARSESLLLLSLKIYDSRDKIMLVEVQKYWDLHYNANSQVSHLQHFRNTNDEARKFLINRIAFGRLQSRITMHSFQF